MAIEAHLYPIQFCSDSSQILSMFWLHLFGLMAQPLFYIDQPWSRGRGSRHQLGTGVIVAVGDSGKRA